MSREQHDLMSRIGRAAVSLEAAALLLEREGSPAAQGALTTLGRAATSVLKRLAHEPLPDCLTRQVLTSVSRYDPFARCSSLFTRHAMHVLAAEQSLTCWEISCTSALILDTILCIRREQCPTLLAGEGVCRLL